MNDKNSGGGKYLRALIAVAVVALLCAGGVWAYKSLAAENDADDPTPDTVYGEWGDLTAKHKHKKNKKKNKVNKDYNANQERNRKDDGIPSAMSSNDRMLIVITNHSLPEKLINYTGFRISFNSRLHIPNWVAWELTSEEVDGRRRRSNEFHRDAKVDGCSESWDYNDSGYDRGHMAPAGDNKWNANAMYDCFSMANMCPQDYDLNHGSWRILEEKCRDWAKKYKSLFIICGPVATDTMNKHIGRTKVAVPERFFKVVVAPYANPPRGIGFMFPNKDVPGGLQRCAVTIDEVERITGHDFFEALPDNIENTVEAQCQFYQWER